METLARFEPEQYAKLRKTVGEGNPMPVKVYFNKGLWSSRTAEETNVPSLLPRSNLVRLNLATIQNNRAFFKFRSIFQLMPILDEPFTSIQ